MKHRVSIAGLVPAGFVLAGLALAGLALFSLVLSACAPGSDVAESEPPKARNVLLITFDTARHDILGAYGDPGGYSPVTDAVAARGLVYENAYSTAPFTGPAHASILTGQHPSTHGIIYNGHRVMAELGTESLSIAEHLAAQGFATGAVISNGVLDARFGFARGFASYVRHDDPQPGDKGGSAGGVREHTVRWLDQLAADETGPTRFFYWVHFIESHLPYVVSDEVKELFDLEDQNVDARQAKALPTDRVRKIYGADFYEADREFGAILARLDELGWSEDTLIVITSDHGEYLHEHGLVDHSLLYEPVLHVPLILAGPGIEPGTRRSELVSVIDVPDLITEALGVSPLLTSQGTHMRPAENGREIEPAVFAEWRHYRLLLDPEKVDPAKDFLVSIQQGPRKLVRSVLNPGQKYYFNLAEDPLENTDFRLEEPDHMELLERRHSHHVKEVLPAGLLGVDEVAIDDEALEILKALGYVE